MHDHTVGCILSKKKMKKLLLIFFAVSLHAGETNIYQSITKRNAFELTSETPRPILPPVSEILRPSVFLTGITRFNGIRKIHLVLRKAGEPDKFVSLAINEKQHNVELKKIYKNSALISNNESEQLMSFKNNGLPTIITKPQSIKKESIIKSDIDRNERRRQYDEWRKRNE